MKVLVHGQLLRGICACVFLLALLGCSGAAGFWTSYEPARIVERRSDQGPWGGKRWVLWQGPAGTFTPQGAVAFATEHGWQCRPAEVYSAEKMQGWVLGKQRVFPLMDEAGVASDTTNWFPRPIDRDSVVVRCETGFIKVDPGTGDTSPAHGYIHIGLDGRDMAVYHLWGE